jgi:hypothetical protein
LYLRGAPYHRIVYDVPDPVAAASTINRWLDCNVTHQAGPHPRI